MKKLLLVSSLILSTTLIAAPSSRENKFGKLIVEEISNEEFESLNSGGTQGGGANSGALKGIVAGTTSGETTPELPIPTNPIDKVEQAGKVIQTARDMVALGESIYELVKKGKPTNTTEYAPISVVPRDPVSKEIADVFDLENFSMPVEKTFSTKITNGVGKTVVAFTYKVIYSYGGSYNGAGKYLTNVLIVPGSVKTSYGWDFNATMKLSGMMNHGTKAEPVAGVMVTIKYQMNSWSAAFERNDTIHITGRGELKNMNK